MNGTSNLTTGGIINQFHPPSKALNSTSSFNKSLNSFCLPFRDSNLKMAEMPYYLLALRTSPVLLQHKLQYCIEIIQNTVKIKLKKLINKVHIVII